MYKECHKFKYGGQIDDEMKCDVDSGDRYIHAVELNKAISQFFATSKNVLADTETRIDRGESSGSSIDDDDDNRGDRSAPLEASSGTKRTSRHIRPDRADDGRRYSSTSDSSRPGRPSDSSAVSRRPRAESEADLRGASETSLRPRAESDADLRGASEKKPVSGTRSGPLPGRSRGRGARDEDFAFMRDALSQSMEDSREIKGILKDLFEQDRAERRERASDSGPRAIVSESKQPDGQPPSCHECPVAVGWNAKANRWYKYCADHM